MTGSQNFTKSMRVEAQKRGYSLGNFAMTKDYGFEKGKTLKAPSFKVNSEKDVFDLLGMKYKKPEERNI